MAYDSRILRTEDPATLELALVDPLLAARTARSWPPLLTFSQESRRARTPLGRRRRRNETRRFQGAARDRYARFVAPRYSPRPWLSGLWLQPCFSEPTSGWQEFPVEQAQRPLKAGSSPARRRRSGLCPVRLRNAELTTGHRRKARCRSGSPGRRTLASAYHVSCSAAGRRCSSRIRSVPRSRFRFAGCWPGMPHSRRGHIPLVRLASDLAQTCVKAIVQATLTVPPR